jgi:integrase
MARNLRSEGAITRSLSKFNCCNTVSGITLISRDELQKLTDLQVGFICSETRPVESLLSKNRVRIASQAVLPLDEGLIRLLADWRKRTEFGKDEDWVWASPFSAGEMPYYLNAVQRDYIIPAALKAGIGNIGWHVLRHTYRAWLNAAGTPLGVQKDLMRHANISTTANVHGAGVLPAMREANGKVVRMVIQ